MEIQLPMSVDSRRMYFCGGKEQSFYAEVGFT
jgi:hypothetical protein